MTREATTLHPQRARGVLVHSPSSFSQGPAHEMVLPMLREDLSISSAQQTLHRLPTDHFNLDSLPRGFQILPYLTIEINHRN